MVSSGKEEAATLVVEDHALQGCGEIFVGVS
jgi:hypothetical protein